MKISKLERLRSDRPAASTKVNSCKPSASFPGSSKLSFSSTASPCNGRGLRTARCKRRPNQPWSTSGNALRNMSKIKSASSVLSSSSSVANAANASTKTPTCASAPGRSARSRPTPGIACNHRSARTFRRELGGGSFGGTGGSMGISKQTLRAPASPCKKGVCFSAPYGILPHPQRHQAAQSSSRGPFRRGFSCQPCPTHRIPLRLPTALTVLRATLTVLTGASLA